MSLFSPSFSHQVVAKRRKVRPECVAPRVTGGPRKRTVGTLRRPTECNTVRADHFADAVEGV